MPRIGQLIVIDQVIDGTTPIETDPAHYEMLGRADSYTVQVYVSNSAGTNPTITVTYQASNDGRSWISKQTVLSSQDITSTPYESMTDSTTDMKNGAQGKLLVQLGGTTPSAYVRVSVCLRTD